MLASGLALYRVATNAPLVAATTYPVVLVAPFWGRFTLLPSADSRVWSQPHGSDSVLFCWENLLFEGDPQQPSTVQCQLGSDGSVVWHYGMLADGAAVIDSTLPCVLRLTGQSNNDTIEIPWHPMHSPSQLRLRLLRGEQYTAALSRVPENSGFTSAGFWKASLSFAAVPDLPDLDLPSTVEGGMQASFCGTVHVLAPITNTDGWQVPGIAATPACQL